MNKIVALIVLLGFLIRIVNFQYPPLLWDEAALGYNAYSILHTGRDEYGQFLPLVFKSFGDYKPGLYVYLCLPFVQIFGLNELSVRLPSIILGSLIPLLGYLLLSPKNQKLALIFASLLAFSPVNIHYSRQAWETNILLFELLLGTYLYSKNKYSLAALAFASTFYTYQSGKLITPIIVFLLTLVFHKVNFKFLTVTLLLAVPIFFNTLFSSGGNRLQVASLFSYPQTAQEIAVITSESGSLDYLALHNQYFNFARQFLWRYFNHFSPEYLFFVGDWQNPRHSAPYLGILLLPNLIFLVIGFFTQKKSPQNLFFSLWLLLAPLTSALNRDSVQTTRSLTFTLPLLYFCALGLHHFFTKYQSAFFKLVIILPFALSFIYWSDLYFAHLTKKSPIDTLYGYRQATQYLINNYHKHDHFYFTDFYGQPYIFYLFYSQYDPSHYQSQASLTTNGVDAGKIESIDNIKFSVINPNSLPPQSLAIYSHDDLLRFGLNPQNFTPLSRLTNDYSTFYVYSN